VLTDGKKWRLYYGPTSHRLDSYYEVDLPTVLEKGDIEDFKYFYLFSATARFSKTLEATASSTTSTTNPTFSHRTSERIFRITFMRRSRSFRRGISNTPTTTSTRMT